MVHIWNPPKLPKEKPPGAEQTVYSFPFLLFPVLTGKVYPEGQPKWNQEQSQLDILYEGL